MKRIALVVLGLSAAGCSPDLSASECGGEDPCTIGYCVSGVCVVGDADRPEAGQGEGDAGFDGAVPDAGATTDATAHDAAAADARPDGSRFKDAGIFEAGLPGDVGAPDSSRECPPETPCDGIDNDCDGLVDEATPCTVGLGICAATGMTACTDGVPSCEAEPLPAADEICDGLDNNCDGRVDEAFPELGERCNVGAGTCLSNGQLVCALDGRGTRCDAVPGLISAEICDNLDNDCDGLIDENIFSTCYPGPFGTADVGECRSGRRQCNFGVPGQCEGSIEPAVEICDGRDNNCDGAVDENVPPAFCYSGTDRELAAPATGCRPGLRQCGNQMPCEGEVRPADTDGCNQIDDDCDGTIDEDCACRSGQPCNGEAVGACVPGVQVCDDNNLLIGCNGRIDPIAEVCDGADNDCDGQIDNDADSSCYGGPADTEGQGECRAGIQRCDDGVLAACADEVRPTQELCDGRDNDCDGLVDEIFDTLNSPCTAGLGVCVNNGTVVCAPGGADVECSARPGVPQAETCDGLDNDCDGSTDEGIVLGCYSGPENTAGQGICREGTRACIDGAPGPCEGQVVPQPEDCDGGDEDCDGQIDNGCACVDGSAQPCGTNEGRCTAGNQICANGQWGACVGATGPFPVECDLVDDDCDGDADEAVPQEDCYDGPDGTQGVGLCRGGARVCSGGWSDCGDILPVDEICNGLDDDCDGTIDEDVGGVGSNCDTGAFGECGAGSVACTDGAIECLQQHQATDEICDGLDNDCDGSVDDNIVQAECDVLGPNGNLLFGQCRLGLTHCVAGATVCSPQFDPVDELCDSLDNDCDGGVDESISFSSAPEVLSWGVLPGQKLSADESLSTQTNLGVAVRQAAEVRTRQMLQDGSMTPANSLLRTASRASLAPVSQRFGQADGNSSHVMGYEREGQIYTMSLDALGAATTQEVQIGSGRWPTMATGTNTHIAWATQSENDFQLAITPLPNRDRDSDVVAESGAAFSQLSLSVVGGQRSITYITAGVGRIATSSSNGNWTVTDLTSNGQTALQTAVASTSTDVWAAFSMTQGNSQDVRVLARNLATGATQVVSVGQGAPAASRWAPAIAETSTGFGVVWIQADVDSNALYFRRFQANGAPLSAPQRLIGALGDTRVQPALATTNNDDLFVLYGDEGNAVRVMAARGPLVCTP